MRVILQNGTEGTNSGRLEILYSSRNIWSTICFDENFGSVGAEIACGQLGYPEVAEFGTVEDLK